MDTNPSDSAFTDTAEVESTAFVGASHAHSETKVHNSCSWWARKGRPRPPWVFKGESQLVPEQSWARWKRELKQGAAQVNLKKPFPQPSRVLINYLSTQSQPMKCSKNKAFRNAGSARFSNFRH